MGAGLRTWLNVGVLSFAFIIILFYNAWIEGWNNQAVRDLIEWEYGYGQIRHADYDPAVDYDDFRMDPDIWENHIWPTIATRIPQFDSLKIVTEWAGHYAYNTLDQNAVIGPHTEVQNFLFLNGFSGHGLQQSPAMGRGMSELITYGDFRSLDLSPFGYRRIVENRPYMESAII